MKGLFILLGALGIVGAGAGFWYLQGTPSGTGGYRTAPLERGNLLATISATGTLQAENVVDVGAQNSVPLQIKSFGLDLYRHPDQLRNLYGLPGLAADPWASLSLAVRYPHRPIDYNSPVKKGQVLAQLDEALYQFQKDQASAEVATSVYNIRKLEADLNQQRAKFNQASNEYRRAKDLRTVSSATEFDAAETAYFSTRAIVESGDAALNQARKALDRSHALLRQAETNLSYTAVRSPIDGIIIDRRVNVGQTVVSGLTASSLFLIAEDLKRLEVWASVNEADVGAIKEKLDRRERVKVRFTVDAYPNEFFYGEVKETRLNAQMTQNVVTYTVVVYVDNSSGRLWPYMTANMQFEVNQADNALLVPNAGLRWKPLLTQVVPEARDAYARSLQQRPPPRKPGDSTEKKRMPEGTVWVQDGAFVRPVRVKLGLTDGTQTEVLEVVHGTLDEDTVVVIGAVTANGDAKAEGSVNNPFAPQIPQKSK